MHFLCRHMHVMLQHADCALCNRGSPTTCCAGTTSRCMCAWCSCSSHQTMLCVYQVHAWPSCLETLHRPARQKHADMKLLLLLCPQPVPKGLQCPVHTPVSLDKPRQLACADPWLLLQRCCFRGKHLHRATDTKVEQHNGLRAQQRGVTGQEQQARSEPGRNLPDTSNCADVCTVRP
jgi:hypothetical protein